MTDTTALRELLERAVALEEKQLEELGGPAYEVPEVESIEELKARLEQLEDQVFALQNSSEPGVDATADAEAAGAERFVDGGGEDFGWGVDVDPADFDDPKGMDFDEPDVDPFAPVEAKAFGACPSCGSTDVDEFADGRAACADCGFPMTEAKALDFGFDEDDDTPAEWDGQAWVPLAGKADDASLEVKSDSDALSEMELLMARRAELDV